jgi:stage V sporulation protein B
MQDSKKFALDVATILVASAFNMFLAFLISVLLGRYLGAEDLGLYRIIASIYAIVLLIAALGLPSALIKYVAEYKSDQNRLNEIVSSGIITSLLLAAIAMPALYFLSGPLAYFFHMPRLSDLFKILSIVFPFILVDQVLLGMFNGLREMKWYAIYYILQGIVTASTTAVLIIYLGFGVTGAVMGMVVAAAVSCIFLSLVSSRYFRPVGKNFFENAKMLLSFSAPIVITNGINTVNYQADTIVTGYYLNAADVGYYGASINLSRLLWTIPQAFQMITYPATSEYWSRNNHAALQKMIDKSMKYSAYLLSVCGLAFAFFASDIVGLIYGTKFGDSVLPLQILLVGTVIWGVVISIGGSVTGAGRPDIGMRLVAISAITNLALNLLLIPVMGIAGAAIATTTSLAVASLVGIYLTVKIVLVKIDYKWFGEMMLLLILSITAFYLLEPISHYLTGVAILVIFIITIVLFLLEDEDKNYLWVSIKKIKNTLMSLGL